MDLTEIRMRCIEVAQAATRSPTVTAPEVIVSWASKFEAYVVGEEKPARAKKEAKAT